MTIKDFEIQGPLGEGSFGKVYLALQKGSKKHVAVKVLDKYHIMKVRANVFTLLKHNKVESVFRERNILQELSHPSIIKQHLTFQDDQNLYFIFEYAGRGSLTKLINRLNMGEDRMPLALVKIYTAEIILALHAMHSRFIIHRDLKPENILVADNWHLKVVSSLIGSRL